jgi:hypothetical protein
VALALELDCNAPACLCTSGSPVGLRSAAAGRASKCALSGLPKSGVGDQAVGSGALISVRNPGLTNGLPGAAEATADVYKSESPAWGKRGFLMEKRRVGTARFNE